MVAAILITGLVLMIFGVWFLVFTISCMSAARRAFELYVQLNDPCLPPIPPTGCSPAYRNVRHGQDHIRKSYGQ